MSYDDFETSDGRPVQLLIFANGLLRFRYTNVARPITVGVDVYTPLAYSYNEPALSKDSDDAQLRMRMPRTATVLALYAGAYRSSPTTLTINRFHDNDPDGQIITHFKGEVASVNRESGEGVMLIIPFQEGGHEIPRYTFQSQCNSFLYDSPGCSLTRGDWSFAGTITTIANGVEVEIAGLRAAAAALDAGVSSALTSDELDRYWQAGYLVTVDGEVREIMEGNFGSDPDVLRLLHPFRSAQAGDAVTVFAGCEKSLDICNRKFDNAINFQGFAFVPEVDPAHTELPPGTRTTPGNFAGFS